MVVLIVITDVKLGIPFGTVNVTWTPSGNPTEDKLTCTGEPLVKYTATTVETLLPCTTEPEVWDSNTVNSGRD